MATNFNTSTQAQHWFYTEDALEQQQKANMDRLCQKYVQLLQSLDKCEKLPQCITEIPGRDLIVN